MVGEIIGLICGSLLLILGISMLVNTILSQKLAKKYAAEWEILNPNLARRIREIDKIVEDYSDVEAEINMYKKEVDFLQNEVKYVLDKGPYQEALIGYYSKIEVLLRKKRDYLRLMYERNEYVHQQHDYIDQKIPKWLWY